MLSQDRYPKPELFPESRAQGKALHSPLRWGPGDPPGSSKDIAGCPHPAREQTQLGAADVEQVIQLLLALLQLLEVLGQSFKPPIPTVCMVASAREAKGRGQQLQPLFPGAVTLNSSLLLPPAPHSPALQPGFKADWLEFKSWA